MSARILPLIEMEIQISEVDTHVFKIDWTPKKRLVAYGSLLFFVLVGAFLWPMGMHAQSGLALLWYVGMFCTLGYGVAASWSAYKDVQNREPFGGYMIGPRPAWWDSDSLR